MSSGVTLKPLYIELLLKVSFKSAQQWSRYLLLPPLRNRTQIVLYTIEATFGERDIPFLKSIRSQMRLPWAPVRRTVDRCHTLASLRSNLILQRGQTLYTEEIYTCIYVYYTYIYMRIIIMMGSFKC